jgi:hypothetical protein
MNKVSLLESLAQVASSGSGRLSSYSQGLEFLVGTRAPSGTSSIGILNMMAVCVSASSSARPPLKGNRTPEPL